MGDFYTDLAAVATRLLTDKGQKVTLSRETSSSFNPATGVNTTATSTFSGYGAAFDYNHNEIDGDLIKKGDIRFILEATTTVPLAGDITTIDSVIYRVMSVKKTSPAGTPVMYTLQLRK